MICQVLKDAASINTVNERMRREHYQDWGRLSDEIKRPYTGNGSRAILFLHDNVRSYTVKTAIGTIYKHPVEL